MLCDTCVLKLIRVKTLSFVFGSITKRLYCHSLYFGGLNRCTRNAIIHTFSMSPVRLIITICRIFCRVYILIISYVYFLSSRIFKSLTPKGTVCGYIHKEIHVRHLARGSLEQFSNSIHTGVSQSITLR